jgi:hypothetical protein
MTLAWGSKVSPDFRTKIRSVCLVLGIDPSWLMACMAFESGETFSSSVRNAAGSGAVGLIQFMPSTAAALGTTVDDLAAITPEQQIDYVARYFAPWKGRLHNLGDVYGAILWPGMIGKPDGWIVFNRADPVHPARYQQNAGLDLNKDGVITKAEVVSRVQAKLDKGLLAPLVWVDPA